MNELPTEELFREAIGDTLEMRLSPDASVQIVMVEVTSLGERDVRPETGIRARPFSVIFQGPHDLEAPQGIYGLAHTRLGEFELFLVPLQPDSEGTRFEAVFG